MTTALQTTIPGFVAVRGRSIPHHSDVSFTVRHMMVSKVRGDNAESPRSSGLWGS